MNLSDEKEDGRRPMHQGVEACLHCLIWGAIIAYHEKAGLSMNGPTIRSWNGPTMLRWWRRRRERRQQVVRDADNLEALFGDRAYSVALARARLEDDEGRDNQHWLAVRQEIARRVKKEIGLDTGTRYLDR